MASAPSLLINVYTLLFAVVGGVPVRVSGSLNRGKIELRYSSREELERVYGKLVS